MTNEQANIQAFIELNRLIVANIKANPDTAKIRASGRFESYIQSAGSVQISGNRFVKYTVPYTPYIDSGRPKGGIPKGFMGIIYEWSKDKGIAFGSDQERKSFAYLTAQKIKKEGSRKFREPNKRTTIIDQAITQSFPPFLRILGENKKLSFQSEVQEEIQRINSLK